MAAISALAGQGQVTTSVASGQCPRQAAQPGPGSGPTSGMYFSRPLDCWVVEGYAEAMAVMREPALES